MDLDDSDMEDIDEPEAGEIANLENVSLGMNHMRCAVHTLQLAIQDRLNPLVPSATFMGRSS